MIKAFITLVSLEYEFEKPAILVAGIRYYRLKILIGFKHDYWITQKRAIQSRMPIRS